MKTNTFVNTAFIVFSSVFLLSSNGKPLPNIDIKIEKENPEMLSKSKTIVNNKSIIYDASNRLRIDDFPEDLEQLDIFNKQGRKMVSINKFDNAIYLNSLKRGSYSVKAAFKSGKIIYRKFIKH